MTKATQSDTSPKGNIKKVLRARRWSMTLNNYTEEEYNTLTQYFKKKEWLYIIGKEVGEEKKTPHLQIYIEAKNAVSNIQLDKIIERKAGSDVSQPLIHFKSKGTREQNVKYCSKENNFITNIEIEIDIKKELINIEYNNITWKDWQQNVLNIINQEIDKRKIYWYWEQTGNVGKSFLAKYICLTNECIIATGKSTDIFNQLLNWRNKNTKTLQLPIIIIDNPRSEFGHINYSAIESLKNGFIYSGKYEGGQIFGLTPHVIVFANNEPNYNELSEDRLIIYKIEEDL